VFVLDGAAHARERKLMMPPFHGERMRAYGEVMRAVTDDAIDQWPAAGPIAVLHEMQQITLAIILRTVFGLDASERLARMSEVLRELLRESADPSLYAASVLFSSSGLKRLISRLAPRRRVQGGLSALGGLVPFTRVLDLIGRADAMIFDEIAARRRAGTHGREDVLSLLLEARRDDGSGMSDEELRDELITLLLAGHETTANLLAWTLHLVLGDARVLREIRAELARVGVRACGPGAISIDRLDELTYLDAVIKEVMRLQPPIPFLWRRVKQQLRIGGHDLPAGVGLSACIYLAHRNPRLYPDPQAFRPERFLAHRFGPHEYLPYGGGVRRCLGAAFASYEMKIVLVEIFARTEMEPVLERAPIVRRGLTFAPPEDMHVVLQRPAPPTSATAA
jgi:cytochrome P450